MASPALAGTVATTSITVGTTTPAYNLPGSISAGETLFIVARAAAPGVGGTISGWTALATDNTSTDGSYIFYRKADGTEGATASGSGFPNSKHAAVAFRVSGGADPTVTAPQVSTVAIGNSTTPNPTTVTPTGGSKDYLFIWAGTWEGEQTSPPASNPTNYSSPAGASTGTGGAVASNAQVAVAFRQLTAASEDPGSWTISVADDWTAWAIAVHPGGPTISPAQLTHTRDFYNATVSPQVKPAQLTHTRDIYSPSKVSPQLLLAQLTHTRDFYSPTVSVGTSVGPAALLTSNRTVYSPAVSPQVLPEYLQHTREVYSNSLTVFLTPGLLTHSRDIYEPSIPSVAGAYTTFLEHRNSKYGVRPIIP
jgi:hypothetical protein